MDSPSSSSSLCLSFYSRDPGADKEDEASVIEVDSPAQSPVKAGKAACTRRQLEDPKSDLWASVLEYFRVKANELGHLQSEIDSKQASIDASQQRKYEFLRKLRDWYSAAQEKEEGPEREELITWVKDQWEEFDGGRCWKRLKAKYGPASKGGSSHYDSVEVGVSAAAVRMQEVRSFGVADEVLEPPKKLSQKASSRHPSPHLGHTHRKQSAEPVEDWNWQESPPPPQEASQVSQPVRKRGRRAATAEPTKKRAASRRTGKKGTAGNPYDEGHVLLCLRTSGAWTECHVMTVQPSGYVVRLHDQAENKKELTFEEAPTYLREVHARAPSHSPRNKRARTRSRVRPASPKLSPAAKRARTRSRAGTAQSTAGERVPRARSAFLFFQILKKAEIRAEAERAVMEGMTSDPLFKVMAVRTREMWKALDKNSALYQRCVADAKADKQRAAAERLALNGGKPRRARAIAAVFADEELSDA